MKINLKDVFDSLDAEEINKIPESTLNTKQMPETAGRVREKTFNKLGIQTKKEKRIHLPVKRFLAIACAAAVIVAATTVGAANYFNPDNAINQMIELNDRVDYSTLGTDLDITASSNGLDFHIDQVLCDNTIMYIPIECPKYKGRFVRPKTEPFADLGDTDPEEHCHLLINGKDRLSGMGVYTGNEELSYKKNLQENCCYITLTDLEGIRNNSEIKLIFDKLVYFDVKDENDICDAEGNWEFTFTLNRSNTRQKLDVEDMIFENGEHYVSKSFIISPLGFEYKYNLKYEEPTGEYEETEIDLENPVTKAPFGSDIMFSETLARHLSGKAMITIEMLDGTIYTDSDEQYDIESHSSSSVNDILKKNSGELSGTFNSAIDVQNIKSITILDKVIYQK